MGADMQRGRHTPGDPCSALDCGSTKSSSPRVFLAGLGSVLPWGVAMSEEGPLLRSARKRASLLSLRYSSSSLDGGVP